MLNPPCVNLTHTCVRPRTERQMPSLPINLSGHTCFKILTHTPQDTISSLLTHTRADNWRAWLGHVYRQEGVHGHAQSKHTWMTCCQHGQPPARPYRDNKPPTLGQEGELPGRGVALRKEIPSWTLGHRTRRGQPITKDPSAQVRIMVRVGEPFRSTGGSGQGNHSSGGEGSAWVSG
jgi:hypothetical protein